jgi:hypothetical protein
MISKNILDLLETAGQKLTFVERELSRPSEDSVTFSVCHFSNNAIREFLVSLIAYNYSLEFPREDLLIDTLKHLEKWDVDFLIEYCAKLDPSFADLDISTLNCSSLEKDEQDEIYCLGLDKVRNCATTARKIEKMVSNFISTNTTPKDNSELHKAIISSFN